MSERKFKFPSGLTDTIFNDAFLLHEMYSYYAPSFTYEDKELINSDRPDLMPAFDKLHNFFLEMYNGPCVKNQLAIYKYRLSMTQKLIYRDIDDCDSDYFMIKQAFVRLVISLIEGSHPDIVMFVAKSIDPGDLFNEMISLVKKLFLYIKSGERAPKFSINRRISPKKNKSVSSVEQLQDLYEGNAKFSEHILLQISIEIYQILKTMSYSNTSYLRFLQNVDEQYHLFKNGASDIDEKIIYYGFVKKNILEVEVIKPDSKGTEILHQVYCQKIPMCFFLTDGSKIEFQNNVNFDSRDTKINELFKNAPIFEIEMKNNLKKNQNYHFIYSKLTPDNLKRIEQLIFVITIVTNIYVLVVYNWGDNDSTFEPDDTHFYAILALAIFELIIACIAFAGWCFIQLEATYKKEAKKFTQKYVNIKNLHIGIKFFYILLFKSLVMQSSVIGFIITIVTSVLYLSIRSPIFLGIKFINIFGLSETARYVLNSIFKNGRQLIITLILGILFVYCYALIVAENYKDYLQPEDVKLEGQVKSDEQADFCHNLFECFLYILNEGTRNAGVADVLYLEEYEKNVKSYVGRFFLDMSFFILINVIILNIIFGIIIDTFAAMRDLAQQRAKDSYNFCFICNLDRGTFESEGIDFATHIEKDHLKWKYIYFYMHLKKKKQADYDGMEEYVAELIKNREYQWIPLSTSFSLIEKERIKKEIVKIDTVNLTQDSQEKIFNKMSELTEETKKNLLAEFTKLLEAKTAEILKNASSSAANSQPAKQRLPNEGYFKELTERMLVVLLILCCQKSAIFLLIIVLPININLPKFLYEYSSFFNLFYWLEARELRPVIQSVQENKKSAIQIDFQQSNVSIKKYLVNNIFKYEVVLCLAKNKTKQKFLKGSYFFNYLVRIIRIYS